MLINPWTNLLADLLDPRLGDEIPDVGDGREEDPLVQQDQHVLIIAVRHLNYNVYHFYEQSKRNNAYILENLRQTLQRDNNDS